MELSYTANEYGNWHTFQCLVKQVLQYLLKLTIYETYDPEQLGMSMKEMPTYIH